VLQHRLPQVTAELVWQMRGEEETSFIDILYAGHGTKIVPEHNTNNMIVKDQQREYVQIALKICSFNLLMKKIIIVL
jgi:hypothetical protein